MGTTETARQALVKRWSNKDTPIERATKFDEDRRAIFLENLSKTGRWYESAKVADISYQCVKDTIKRDSSFESLTKLAEGEYKNLLHREAQRRAVEGVEDPVFYEGKIVGYRQKFSDRLLEIMLKRHDPAFKDSLSVSGGIDVQVGVLAVTTGKTKKTPEQWAKDHGGEKLDPNRLPMVDAEGTVVNDE